MRRAIHQHVPASAGNQLERIVELKSGVAIGEYGDILMSLAINDHHFVLSNDCVSDLIEMLFEGISVCSQVQDGQMATGATPDQLVEILKRIGGEEI